MYNKNTAFNSPLRCQLNTLSEHSSHVTVTRTDTFVSCLCRTSFVKVRLHSSMWVVL